jgi:hypothetical protein
MKVHPLDEVKKGESRKGSVLIPCNVSTFFAYPDTAHNNVSHATPTRPKKTTAPPYVTKYNPSSAYAM